MYSLTLSTVYPKSWKVCAMFKCVIQDDIKTLSSVSQGHKQKVTLINTAILFNLKPSVTASMQNHIENHHPFPDESSSGNVGMSFSCDSDANGLYTLLVLFKKAHGKPRK